MGVGAGPTLSTIGYQMTVKELITLLSQIKDQDLPVNISDYKYGNMSVDYIETLSQRKNIGFKNEGIYTWVQLSHKYF